MLKKFSKCLLSTLLVCVGIMPLQNFNIQASDQAKASQADYKLYPKPQSIDYLDGNYILQEGINVVYDEGIDQYTRDKLEQTAALKKLNVSVSNKAQEGKTNLYIGIYGSKGGADLQITNSYNIDKSVFDKTDAYYLRSDNGTLSILGKDSDASYYGVTTLYQILAQMDSYSIRNFEIKDYADVKSRGFIEGYYGNPWSLEDRIDLMKFGGNFKMNAYFYAPKDDPKHNAKWRELYTEAELKNIEALAKAGNESKCRFIFALHPFMNSAMRFDTEEHYQEDLAIMKNKFKQVIDKGVRQISILDDDAALPGGKASNAIRVLDDMSAWLKEVQKEYPDMKMTLPYVPADYMGNGAGSELQTLKQAPDNVQIVMTGGRVWGEVSKNFTETFASNMGTGPFMWVNWPCTDNSKKHLIMGGNSTFLHPGVDPNKLQGIMLNPMQQSEPSKVAIFANATYAWNIWETNEEADQAWEDAFSFVDHNTAVPSVASKALFELSKHMMNQAMDSRVTPLQESIELKKLLTPYKDKLKNRTVTIADTDALINEFEILQKAAKTYRNNAGNTRTRDQIVYWLNSWDDTTSAALAYLKGIKASLLNDSSSVMGYLSEGQSAFEKSKSYGYHYVDHTEYAEVGVQHIVPFIKESGTYLNNFVKSVIDPSLVNKTFITNRSDTPTGDVANVFDGSDATNIIYKTPSSIKKDDYIGVLYSKAIDIKTIRFLLGGGKDHYDQSKLQYTVDGKTWEDLDGTLYTGVDNKELTVKAENLTLHAMGVRLIATKDNTRDAWLQVNEIAINEKKADSDVYYPAAISLDQLSEQSGKGKANIIDGNVTSESWLAKGPYSGADRDGIPVDATATLTFNGGAKPIGKIFIAQGSSAAGDVISSGVIEYLDENGTWVTLGNVTNAKEQTINAPAGIVTTAVRIRNTQKTSVWWRFAEFQVFPAKEAQSDEFVYTNITTAIQSKIEGNVTSLTPGNVTLQSNDYIGLKLDNIRQLTSVNVNDIPTGVRLQTSMNGIVWTTYDAAKETNARYIRAINEGPQAINMDIKRFEVEAFELSAAKLLLCTTPIAPGWGDGEDMRPLKNDGNLFDGKLTTGAEIGGLPSKGDVAVFDLGQRRNFTTFAYYVVESQLNYLRDGIFEVADAADAPDGDWKPLLVVGDGVENVGTDDANRKAKDYAEFTHDSKNPGNMYKGVNDLNVSGRYLRLRFTAGNKNRAVFFNELQINGGEYISTESNRDVISSVVEEQGKVPSNMFDGDISTTFKPSAKNGNFTYYISEPTSVRTLRFAQNGEVSNATVTAAILNSTKKSADPETITLGKLNQSLTEFVIPNNYIVLSVNVAWTDKIPEIAEIITTSNTSAVSKTLLKAELDKGDNKNWTKASKDAYQKAAVIAQEVYDNAYASQDSVDMAIGSLQSVRGDAKEKADTTTLKALVDAAKKQFDGEIEIYSSRTFATYEIALNEAKTALKDEENIDAEMATLLVSELEQAQTDLMYSSIQIELAQLANDNDANKYAATDHSATTFTLYSNAKTALQLMIVQDSVIRLNPKDVNMIRTTYRNAVEGLANIVALKGLIANIDNLNESLYETQSFAAYKKAVGDAKKLLESGTKEQVKTAEADLKTKEAALLYKSSADLSEIIKEVERLKSVDYTKVTFTILSTSLEAAKRDVALNDDALNKTHITALNNAKAQLIDLRELNLNLDLAHANKAADYTKDTYKVLEKAIKDAELLKENGSVKAIADSCTALQKAINSLVPLAKDVQAYRDAVQKKEAAVYTVDSYRAYLVAYDALMALTLDNTSVAMFQQVRDEFEKAEARLILKEADYSAVQNALKKVPQLTSLYTKESVANLQKAIQEVVYGKKADEQKIVDAYAKKILKAIDELTYIGADYAKVKDILASVPKDTSMYTKESVERLMNAIEAIDYNKTVLEQNAVDAYAVKIKAAIDGLVRKSNDLSKPNHPNTGDRTNAAGLTVLLTFAGIALYTTARKRKNEQ